MSSFARRNEGNESYMMNQPLAMPSPYGHSDGHDFGATGSGSYHQFSHQSFHPYGSQLGPSYAHQGLQHLQQYSSDHSIPSMSNPEDMGMHHPPLQYLAQPRFLTSPRYVPLNETEIESQISQNEGSMQSEPVLPPLEGFPDVKEFDQLMQSYVDDLSVKKQDKALIHSKRARNIKAVLNEPKDTSVESAQFRFWVKKMFKLQAVGIAPDCRKMICHEGKPVAIREKLFKILTKAHQLCQHGGRDKTSAQGSQGAHLSLCENLPNMPGSPWGFTTDAAQFTAQLASARLDPSIPKAPVSPNIKTRVHFWGTGSRRKTTDNELFQPSAYP
ncbi:hypothetical protein N7510_003546 [Penicillium lagena]|uniref:uncharacterized protein n=1 Tax=Penicillium lagena TaxID=94218 RepID=UPI002541178F|nr:uncharacterized protein N7510_003546 [Penicillium lagena]KAJ5619562.1 hypothetical protein N7510_003546 [Penicillium lagena]